jgi:DNA-binding GntR family transcriptional regulator
LAHLARNDMFLIKCFRVREVDGKPLAIEDSSLNAFHIYDENNHILHNELGDRYDYEKFYLQIHVKNEDTGLYSLLNTVDEKNGTNLNRIISWLIPENYTMIEN